MEDNKKQVVDIDFAESPVPKSQRRSTLTMFMIMLGFTFFSASMWVGQELAYGLTLGGFIKAQLLGGVILGLYTGLLGYIGAESGLSLDLLSRKAFGLKGSYLPSAMISFTQIGWFGVGVAMFAIPVAGQFFAESKPVISLFSESFAELPAVKQFFGDSTIATWILVIIGGILMTSSAYFGIKSLTIVSYVAVPLVAVLGTVAMILAVKRGDNTLAEQFANPQNPIGIVAGAGLVIGSFVSGGTATPNFTRFSKTGKSAFIVTVIAFFIGNSLMFFFGGIAGIYAGGNDIFQVMINLNLFYLAVLVLGLNIWTTNDNALYTGGLGLANIFNQKKKPMVLVSGVIGTVAAIWLYNNFCGWLNVLNCTLPPIGIILIIDFFKNRKSYENFTTSRKVNWFAIVGVVAGAVAANLITWGIPSITGMVIAAIVFVIGEFVNRK